MPIIELHYHDHAEHCKRCGTARENMDMLKHLHGDSDEIMKLYDESCETGQDILFAFWMGYGGNINDGWEWEE